MLEPFAQWRQHGDVYFWRFEPQKSGLEGWHFAANAAGKDSMIALLDVLTKSDHPTRRTVKLSRPPERIAERPFSPHHKRKIVSPAALKLLFQPEAEEHEWQLRTEGDQVELSLGRGSVEELAEGLARAKSGDFDFSVGPATGDPSRTIWFW